MRVSVIWLLLTALPAASQTPRYPDYVAPKDANTARLQVAGPGYAAKALVIYEVAGNCFGARLVPRPFDLTRIRATEPIAITVYLANDEKVCPVTFRFEPKANYFYEIYTLMDDICRVAVHESSTGKDPYNRISVEHLRFVGNPTAENSFCPTREQSPRE